MLFSKSRNPVRKMGTWEAAAFALLLVPSLGAGPAMANMGDPSEPMKRTAAAYPEFFGGSDPSPDTAPRRVQRCRYNPQLAATDWNCRRR